MSKPTITSLHERLKKAEELIEQQQRAIDLLSMRLEMVEESNAETISCVLDALRILWLSCGRQNLEKQRDRLVTLGNTLKEYLPDFPEATT